MEARMSDVRLHAGTAWGGLAEVMLAAALCVWILRPAAAAHTVLGASPSVAVVLAAMGMTAVAVGVTRSESRLAHRWTVTLPVETLAAGLAALAMADLFDFGGAEGSGVWGLLLVAAVGMNAVSGRIGRSQEPDDASAPDSPRE